jgi:hypothetical protein
MCSTAEICRICGAQVSTGSGSDTVAMIDAMVFYYQEKCMNTQRIRAGEQVEFTFDVKVKQLTSKFSKLIFDVPSITYKFTQPPDPLPGQPPLSVEQLMEKRTFTWQIQSFQYRK